MPQLEESVYIDVPRDGLWDLVNDMDRMTESVTFADELRYLSDEELGVGTVYREYGGVGPISSESEWEITAFEPPERQVHVSDLGIMEPTLTIEFEAYDGGTRFTQSMAFAAFPQFRPLGRLLEALYIKRALRSGLRETRANLKRLAAAEPAG